MHRQSFRTAVQIGCLAERLSLSASPLQRHQLMLLLLLNLKLEQKHLQIVFTTHGMLCSVRDGETDAVLIRV